MNIDKGKLIYDFSDTKKFKTKKTLIIVLLLFLDCLLIILWLALFLGYYKEGAFYRLLFSLIVFTIGLPMLHIWYFKYGPFKMFENGIVPNYRVRHGSHWEEAFIPYSEIEFAYIYLGGKFTASCIWFFEKEEKSPSFTLPSTDIEYLDKIENLLQDRVRIEKGSVFYGKEYLEIKKISKVEILSEQSARFIENNDNSFDIDIDLIDKIETKRTPIYTWRVTIKLISGEEFTFEIERKTFLPFQRLQKKQVGAFFDDPDSEIKRWEQKLE